MSNTDSKILIISNRGVRPKRTGETLFKNRLTKSDHRLRVAKVSPGSKHKKYALELSDEGTELEAIRNALTSSNGRPWVFFVHGNNQTLHKNLKKCFAFRDLYGVNVITFSWPSVHHGKIRSFLGYIPLQPSIALYTKRQIKRKLKQYGKACKIAKASAQDLVNSLLMYKQAVSDANVSTNFICHSLGHRVLRMSHEIDSLDDTLAPFNHVLLHQADEDNEGHREWVDQINKGDKVIVTTNAKDKALELSNLYHHKTLKNKRLGNVTKNDEPQPPTYRDFSGADNIGFGGHTLFLTTESENPDIYNYFQPIFTK